MPDLGRRTIRTSCSATFRDINDLNLIAQTAYDKKYNYNQEPPLKRYYTFFRLAQPQALNTLHPKHPKHPQP